MSWPIGMGDRFKGVFDRSTNEVLCFSKGDEANAKGKIEAKKFSSKDDPAFHAFMEDEAEQVLSELELVELAGDAFDFDKVLSGNLTPIFFGSAMNNFGIQHFLEKFIEIAPKPAAQKYGR